MARTIGRPSLEIDLSMAEEYDPDKTKEALIMKALRRNKLLGKAFAYTAFDPWKVDFLLAHGTPHGVADIPIDSIDCCILMDGPDGRKSIRHNEDFDLAYYVGRMGTLSEGAIAVYFLKHLADRSGGHPYYRFKDPKRRLDALAGCAVCRF